MTVRRSFHTSPASDSARNRTSQLLEHLLSAQRRTCPHLIAALDDPAGSLTGPTPTSCDPGRPRLIVRSLTKSQTCTTLLLNFSPASKRRTRYAPANTDSRSGNATRMPKSLQLAPRAKMTPGADLLLQGRNHMPQLTGQKRTSYVSQVYCPTMRLRSHLGHFPMPLQERPRLLSTTTRSRRT